MMLRPHRERPSRRRTAKKRDELTSPHICTQAQGNSIVSAQTSTLIGLKPGIKAIAAVHSQCHIWVKSPHYRAAALVSASPK
jgi:hypothetical protein